MDEFELAAPKGHVVVAEDDFEMRRLMAHRLRQRGFHVDEVVNGAELDAYLRKLERVGGDWPDLLISDLRMPGCNGLELLRRLRGTDWSTPFVLISAFIDLATCEEALRLGANRVLAKPLDLDELCLATEELVGSLA